MNVSKAIIGALTEWPAPQKELNFFYLPMYFIACVRALNNAGSSQAESF